MRKAVDFSIAIATYNGAKRLPEVFDFLQRQRDIEGLTWEVLVVDNNSSDNTSEVVSQYSQNWRSNSQLNYLFEPRKGPAYARDRAVKESKSGLIGFLDDDNLPAENWIVEAHRFARENPQVGAYGGNIQAKVDGTPPPYFNRMKRYLTIYSRGTAAFQYERLSSGHKIPALPGLVVRKQAWEEAVPSPEKLLIKGRDENTMAAGEDAEMILYIQNSKWEVWHNPAMKIWHHIYPHRLEKSYLLKLARGYGLSHYLVSLSKVPPKQRSLVNLFIPFYVMRDALKVLKFYIQYKNVLEDDFGKACDLQAKIGQCYSPLLPIYHYLPGHDYV